MVLTRYSWLEHLCLDILPGSSTCGPSAKPRPTPPARSRPSTMSEPRAQNTSGGSKLEGPSSWPRYWPLAPPPAVPPPPPLPPKKKSCQNKQISTDAYRYFRAGTSEQNDESGIYCKLIRKETQTKNRCRTKSACNVNFNLIINFI